MTPRPAYQPSAVQELCLRAALSPGQPGRDAWRRVLAAAALEDLDRACRSLLPLVYRNLAGPGADDREVDGLKERYLETWSANQRIFDCVLPLLRALEQAGIDVIVLKGLAMIAGFYRDPGLRPMADVDVLVAPAEAERAGRVAVGAGWQPRYPLTAAFLRVKHAGPFDHPAGVACDIHWRVFEETGAPGADDEFRAAAGTVAFQGASLRVLSPTDQLFHVCGHAARWDAMPANRWAADAAVILRDGSIDWPRFVSHAARRRFALRMRLMLEYLRRSLDAPIPVAVEGELARCSVSALERLEHHVRGREQQLLGELPTYVFNCFRCEPRPLLALPGYLRDAWGLESLAGVPGRALALATRRLARALPSLRRSTGTSRSDGGR